MASRLELLQEANRRGLLPPDKKALYDEAVKRGLIPGEQPQGQAQDQPAQAAEQPNLPWTMLPQQMLENAPSSAWNAIKGTAQGIGQMVMHPIQTAQTLGDVGAGAIREGARAILPEKAFNYIDSQDPNPEAGQRASQTAGAVGQMIKDRYGSIDALHHTLATDPVGAAFDASTVLSGGSMAAAKMGTTGAKVARALDTASRVTNPITPIVKAGQIAAVPVAGITKGVLGATTGTGAGAVGEAFSAGLKGGEHKAAFTRNMRGQEDQAAVIDQARSAMANITENRRKQYQNDMAVVGHDKTPIDMTPIHDAFIDAVKSAYHGKHQKASKETIDKLNQIQDVLVEWTKDPAVHDAAGLDALKQRIDALMPSFTEAGNAERVVTQVRSAVKDAIVKQVPAYAKAMQGYETSKGLQQEISKSLGLGHKVSIDQTLRRLQSITRNNANTNYGQRVANAQELEKAGAKTLIPSLAGQAMNAGMPRGLMGAGVGAAAALGGALLNPWAYPAMLTASPRLVGELSAALGTAKRYGKKLPSAQTLALIARALAATQSNGQGSR